MNTFNKDLTRKYALKFIVLLGIVSLFADMTYEGARSVIGPFFVTLGASAAIVGFTAGFSEFIGFSFRLISGYLADLTKKYWLITILGFFINMLAVPCLALAFNWQMAAIFVILERLGKAIRNPARDAMLSHAGEVIGMGKGFGIHQLLDQIGAMLGPLIVALVLFLKTNNFRLGFAVLFFPAVITLIILLFAKKQYPNPQALSSRNYQIKSEKFNTIFWIYFIGILFVGAGYADFPLIAYHFEKTHLLSQLAIPIAYAFAQGISGLMAPFLGHWYDRFGMNVIIIITLISLFFAPAVFLGNSFFAWIGVAIWAMGMGMHESLMRAVVGNMVAKEKRASAYGLFNMGYGIAWFIGSVLIGVFYDYKIIYAVIFCVILQLAAVFPLLVVKFKQENRA